MKLNTKLTRLLTGALLAGGLVATAAPAQAESFYYGACTADNILYEGTSAYGVALYSRQPRLNVGGSYSTLCYVQYAPSTYSAGTKSLQFALNKCYRSVTGTTLAVDGYFGSATKAALIKVQKYVGAYPDGVFGNDTRDRMDWPMYTRSSTGTYTLQTYCGIYS